MLIMMWFRDVVARARLTGGQRSQGSTPQSGGLAGENRLLNLASAPPHDAAEQGDRSRREKRHKTFPGQAVSPPVLGRYCSGPKALI
jgi:hypothetical protein